MRKIITMLVLLCAAAIGADGQTTHKLPPLRYATDALEPVMSAETIAYHHGKHLQAYVNNLNRLAPGTPFADASPEEISRRADGAIFNNGAQIFNHAFFFDTFAPEAKAGHAPSGKLARAIDKKFGSLDNFRTEFNKAASAVFGSGWTWLAADASGGLHIISYPNAGNPLRDGYKPLLGFDVWEHSYYIDYRNNRTGYLDDLWRIVDWKVVDNRYNNK